MKITSRRGKENQLKPLQSSTCVELADAWADAVSWQGRGAEKAREDILAELKRRDKLLAQLASSPSFASPVGAIDMRLPEVRTVSFPPLGKPAAKVGGSEEPGTLPSGSLEGHGDPPASRDTWDPPELRPDHKLQDDEGDDDKEGLGHC